jgi:hypothetical protein
MRRAPHAGNGRLALSLGSVGSVLLVVAVACALTRAKETERKRVTTLSHITAFFSVLPPHGYFPSAPHADGSTDPTGQDALYERVRFRSDVHAYPTNDPCYAAFVNRRARLIDEWGNALVYRCPGPVHKAGWDLYSFGANGRDDGGLEDDLLVGEDLAPVSSR